MPTLTKLRLLLTVTILISLFATITNKIPLSLTFVWLIIFLPTLFFLQKSFHKVLMCLLAVYCYFLLSTFLYDPKALVSPLFYRRDGNFFVTFLPLLILGLLCLQLNLEGLVDRFIKFSSFLSLLGVIFYIVSGAFFRSHELYNHFFVAHNAAGGFLAMLLALTIGYWYVKRSRLYFCMMITNSVGLLLTDSKGSIIGLACALIIHYLFKERKIKFVLSVYIVLFIVLLYIVYPIWEELYKNRVDILFDNLEDSRFRTFTLAMRVLDLWPRAFYLWLQSPFIGTGFGSFNDTPYQLDESSFLQFNRAEAIYSDGHAHHSFLNILGETGLLGLFLIIVLLHQIWKFIQKTDSEPLIHSLLIMFWTAIFSSFTEHRLFTPSQMLPFTIILGLALGRYRGLVGNHMEIKSVEKKWLSVKTSHRKVLRR